MDVKRLALLAATVVAVAETYRRGYAAPLLFGVRLHIRARPDWCYEPDPMHREQGGQCAICCRPVELVVDHDHQTGRVRELLCTACNRGLGFMQEDETILLAAIAYLQRHRIRSA